MSTAWPPRWRKPARVRPVWAWSSGSGTSTMRAPARTASIVMPTSRPNRAAAGSRRSRSPRSARCPDSGSTGSKPLARRTSHRDARLIAPNPPRPAAGGNVAMARSAEPSSTGIEESDDVAGRGGEVGVDEQVDVGVGRVADPGSDGVALAPVQRERQHGRPGPGRPFDGVVGRAVVDHHARGRHAPGPHQLPDGDLDRRRVARRHDRNDPARSISPTRSVHRTMVSRRVRRGRRVGPRLLPGGNLPRRYATPGTRTSTAAHRHRGARCSRRTASTPRR